MEHIDGTIKHISERDLTNCGVITADSINSIADGMHKSKMISSAESSSFLLRK